MSRILITGGAGFIGSNLVRRMVNQGHEVLNLDKLTYAGNLNSLSDVATAPNYRFLQADIVDADAVGNAIESFQPTAIMHLAAESHVDRSIDGPREFINTNVGGTLNLLLASLAYWRNLPETAKPSFRFLHVSTDEVYGSLGPTGLFTEETRYDPHSPYSASKAASDHLVRAWHDTYGLPMLITNCSNNYGPYQFPEKLIPVVILKCLRGEPIPVYGKGENIRDWLYVEDHCEALDLVLQRGQTGRTYNVGGNNEWQNIKLVQLLCQLMDELSPSTKPNEATNSHASLITFVTDRPGHDLRYAIDSSRLKTELDWVPKQDNQSGFRKTVQWYLDNRDWWQSILSGDYRLGRLGLHSIGAAQ
jgi:dTDP-glucose 4,6-dehydratase